MKEVPGPEVSAASSWRVIILLPAAASRPRSRVVIIVEALVSLVPIT
jgi:hypothetical protein